MMDAVESAAITQMRYGVQNLFAAARFSQSVGALEAQNVGQPFGPFFEAILADASACLFLAVAALEAYVNELFEDRGQHFEAVPAVWRDEVWEAVRSRGRMIEKFQMLLRLRGATEFKDEQSYKDVDLLVELRN
jgi:hypothetical protein